MIIRTIEKERQFCNNILIVLYAQLSNRTTCRANLKVDKSFRPVKLQKFDRRSLTKFYSLLILIVPPSRTLITVSSTLPAHRVEVFDFLLRERPIIDPHVVD